MIDHSSYRFIQIHQYICFLLGTQKLRLENGKIFKIGKAYKIVFIIIATYFIFKFIMDTSNFMKSTSEKNAGIFGFVISITYFTLVMTYVVVIVQSLTVSPKHFKRLMTIFTEIDDDLKFEDRSFFVRIISEYIIFFCIEFFMMSFNLYSMNYQFDTFPSEQYMLFCIEVECFHCLFEMNMVTRRVEKFNKQLQNEEYSQTDNLSDNIDVDKLLGTISKLSEAINYINKCYGIKVKKILKIEINKHTIFFI